MDMALSRGGDQAVVKDEKDMHYFGGNSEQGENNSRVYARRVAQNVKEHIENYEQVIVMATPWRIRTPSVPASVFTAYAAR